MQDAIRIGFETRQLIVLKKCIIMRILASCFNFLRSYIADAEIFSGDSVLSRYPALIQASLSLLSTKYGVNSSFLEELFFELASQMNLISSYVYLYNTEKIDVELTDLLYMEALKNIRPLRKNTPVSSRHLLQAW
jgi:hypothetical protein